MLKRPLLLLLSLPVILFGYLWLVEGASPAKLREGLQMVTGMGAKLACSGRYISGFDEQTIADDLASYSEVTRLLTLGWLGSEDAQTGGVSKTGVHANLLGLADARAIYREGMGCTLVFGPDNLAAIQPPPVPANAALPWPAGAAPGSPQPALQHELESILAADNAAGYKTRALLVVHQGRIAGEAYAPGIHRDTSLLGWSMGKSVTAIMLGRLEQLGLVDIADRSLFDPWARDERARINLQHLLQMTSGLAFQEDYVPGSDSTRMLFLSADASQVALEKPLAQVPGDHFYYSSGTTNLLARLVFNRVGNSPQAMQDFFHRELALPLALEHTFLEPDATGVPVGSSYAYASARDWARFGQLMVADGVMNGRRLLSAGWVHRAVQPNGSENEPRYGYQFWLNGGGAALRWPSLPAGAYAMLGNRKQVVIMLPQQQAVIVRLGWSSGAYPVDANFARILKVL